MKDNNSNQQLNNKTSDETDIVLVNLNGPTHMTSNYLHALLDQEKIKVKTIHFREYNPRSTPPTKIELELLTKTIKALNPKIIGISVNSMNYFDAKDISESVKNELQLPIIWGGPHPLINPEVCLETADFICNGEADIFLPLFLKNFLAKKDFIKTPNIWIKEGNNIIKNNLGPLVDNLDTLPLPDYSDRNKYYLIDKKVTTTYLSPVRKYVYEMLTSRGCPFRCSYCMNSILFQLFKNKYLRKRSVESVIGELIKAKQEHPKLKSIYFWDDVFVMEPEWLKKFAKEYKAKINVPFFCYCHPLFVKEETIQILKWMGVKMIFIGIESGSPRIRKEIYDRYESDEKIIEATKIIKKYGLKVHYDIITSKFDTNQDFEKSLSLLLKLPKPFRVNHNNLAYYHNFKITKIALDKKIITPEEIAGSTRQIRTQYVTNKEFFTNPELAYYYFIGRRMIPNRLIFYLYKKNAHLKFKRIFSRIPPIIENIDNNIYSFNLMLKLLWYREFSFVGKELKKKITNN